MPLQKNQILTLRIERLSSDGSGVAHSPDGETVFVPGAAPGDEADVRIVKDCKRYAFGILDHLRTPSPDRIPVDCAVAGPCGGCSLRHLDYTAELRAKQENVTDAFRRIGGLDVPVLDICPSPEVDRYRNKVQFPVGLDKNGNPCIGFYAGRTHRIVPCPDCKLQPGVLNDIGNALCRLLCRKRHPALQRRDRPGPGAAHLPAAGRAQRTDHGVSGVHPPEPPPRRCAVHPSAGAVCGHCHHPAQCQQQKHQRDPGHRDPHPVRAGLHRRYALRGSGAAGAAVVLPGEHAGRRAAVRHCRTVRPADPG